MKKLHRYHHQTKSTMSNTLIIILLIAIFLLIIVHIILSVTAYYWFIRRLNESHQYRLPQTRRDIPFHYRQSYSDSNISSSQPRQSIDLGSMPMSMYYSPTFRRSQSTANLSQISLHLSDYEGNSDSDSDRTIQTRTGQRTFGMEIFEDVLLDNLEAQRE
jgi:hypothetical protein